MDYTYTSDPAAIKTVFKYMRATQPGYKGAQAQHKVLLSDESEHWLGCIIVEIAGSECVIEIANGDKFPYRYDSVRIPQQD